MPARAKPATGSPFSCRIRCPQGGGVVAALPTSFSSRRVYSAASGKLKRCYKGSRGDEGSVLKVRGRFPASGGRQGLPAAQEGAAVGQDGRRC